MHKKTLIGVAFLILAALVWASNEPWKEKPYQQWDKADLELVLNNSPWAKKVVVDVNWKRSASSGSATLSAPTNSISKETSALASNLWIVTRESIPTGAVPCNCRSSLKT